MNVAGPVGIVAGRIAVQAVCAAGLRRMRRVPEAPPQRLLLPILRRRRRAKGFRSDLRLPQCGRPVSVIPGGMFPYRSLPVARFEALVDDLPEMAGAGVRPASGDDDGSGPAPAAGGGPRPPPASRLESGCVRRALEKLSERIPLLCGLLGQIMPLAQGPGIDWFWPALRQLGSTESILVRLARDFKTSLLACYRSLRPRCDNGRAPPFNT